MHVIWDTPSAKNIQLEGKNIAVKKGKENVDPARISSDIKDYVERFYPVAVADMHSGGASVAGMSLSAGCRRNSPAEKGAIAG